jgi:hypothetical protein
VCRILNRSFSSSIATRNAPLFAPLYLPTTSKHTPAFTANKRIPCWPKLQLLSTCTNVCSSNTQLGQIHAKSTTRRRLAISLPTTRQDAAPRLILQAGRQPAGHIHRETPRSCRHSQYQLGRQEETRCRQGMSVANYRERPCADHVRIDGALARGPNQSAWWNR